MLEYMKSMWRKILSSKPDMLIPEELEEWLRKPKSETTNFKQFVTEKFDELNKRSIENDKNVKDLTEIFTTLQDELNKKDQEIARYEQGYDAHIFRKFISRFIRVDQAMDDYLSDGKIEIEDLKQIKRVLTDALAECEVEKFSPDLKADYKTAEGVAENPKIEPTTDPDRDYKIKEILKEGYRMKTGNKFEYIVQAKVTIYKFNKNN